MYYFTIPAQAAGSNVDYEIYAEDGEGNGATFPEVFQYIAGNHVFYDDPQVDFVRNYTTGTGSAVCALR